MTYSDTKHKLKPILQKSATFVFITLHTVIYLQSVLLRVKNESVHL